MCSQIRSAVTVGSIRRLLRMRRRRGVRASHTNRHTCNPRKSCSSCFTAKSGQIPCPDFALRVCGMLQSNHLTSLGNTHHGVQHVPTSPLSRRSFRKVPGSATPKSPKMLHDAVHPAKSQVMGDHGPTPAEVAPKQVWQNRSRSKSASFLSPTDCVGAESVGVGADFGENQASFGKQSPASRVRA